MRGTVARIGAESVRPFSGAGLLRIFAVCALPSPPILLRLTLYRWRIRIFHFQPKGRTARAIDGAESLRNDALTAELAGEAEDDLAVALVLLVEYDAQI